MMRYSARLAVLPLLSAFVSACGDDPSGPSAGEEVAYVQISADTVVIPALGFERHIEATAFDADGTALTGVPIEWGSRDPSRVQALSGGLVVARDYGEAPVVARAGDVSDTVLVQALQVPAQMLIEGPDTLWTLGDRDVLTITMSDSAGAPIYDAPSWSSSDSSVAIAIGVGARASLRPQGRAGATTITASLRGVSATFELVVIQRPAFVQLSYDRDGLIVGDTMTIRAWVGDASGEPIPGAPIEFRSSDTTVARIDPQGGLMSVVGGGTTLISAHSGSLSSASLPHFSLGLFSFPHATPPAGALHVSPGVLQSDGFGERFVLEAFVDDGVNPPVSVPATWTARDPSVASVSGSSATTLGDGSTWLVAEYDGRSDSLQLNVDRVPIELSFQSVPRDFTITFTSGMPVYPLTVDRYGGIYQDWFQTTWTVRDPDVAKVTTSGILAVAEGETWVLAELQGLMDSLHVTVLPQWDDDFTVSTQADLDLFSELAIEGVAFGDLRIEGTSLTSLDGLETLRYVLGGVTIVNNPNLVDMGALRDLERVQGTITVQGNPSLVVALPSLREAGGLTVSGNGLLDTDAFAGLVDVGAFHPTGPQGSGSLVIGDNGSVGVEFPSLRRVREALTLFEAGDLQTLSAPVLWRAKSVILERNAALDSLDLPQLSTLIDNLDVRDNEALTSLVGLSALTSGLRRLRVVDNPALLSLDGLRALGDALGSDPIVWDVCEFKGNPELTTPASELVRHLHAKFVGDGVRNCTFG